MAETRQNPQSKRDCDRALVCIDTYRVLDSCRDRDCFENVRVYLTEFGQEIIEKTSAVRVRSAHVIHAYIDIDGVPFNRGFYRLTIRLYTKLECEACLGSENTEDFDGLAVVEKKVVLFGSEGGVSLFRSDQKQDAPCPTARSRGCENTNLPIAAIETVDPIVLDFSITDSHSCRCYSSVDEIPGCVCDHFCSPLVECASSPHLAVSLGFFTVVRLERPAQYLVNATEYNVPNKECVEPESSDPCSVFKKMAFPVEEFSTPSISMFSDASCEASCRDGTCGCGC